MSSNLILTILSITLFLVFLLYRNSEKNRKEKTKKLLIKEQIEANLHTKITELEREKSKVSRDLYNYYCRTNELEVILKEKDKYYEAIKLENENDLNYISLIYADHSVIQYEISSKYFYNSGSQKDKETRLRITSLKEKTKDYLKQLKLMEYRYAYLLTIFPELEFFTEDIKSLKEFREERDINLHNFQDEFDRTRYFISNDEYINLPEDERNQLALERYIHKRKSNWEIGRDYEMFIGYYFSKKKYKIEYFGIENSLNDLGRDIIAMNDDSILIIQCKYWAKEKKIHEKHITQLYGTSIQYILSQHPKKKVIPILITNINLSDTARVFANYLNVEIMENMPLGDFPRIKCNVNKDENGYKTLIYHLPFDQQYDKTKICNDGEFYAFNVSEATSKGFRRAKRFMGT